jgi:phenylpyruvate tautomerase PptA (4-oxalocrotonate tautomerase family)
MPTVTVVTNVELAKADAVKLVEAVTNTLYPIYGCPAAYVHVHVLAGQTVSFGAADCTTPCCHTRIVLAGDTARFVASSSVCMPGIKSHVCV